jgi:hypothetical protein
MSAKSYVCNDCGISLRSIKEAQDHGETSGHGNFAESEEAVLTLVCEECGCAACGGRHATFTTCTCTGLRSAEKP